MAQQGKNAADPSSVNPLIVENDVSTMEALSRRSAIPDIR
jgi:hypothetical protein